MRLIAALMIAPSCFGQGTVIPTLTWTSPSGVTGVADLGSVGFDKLVYHPASGLMCAWGSYKIQAVTSEFNNAWVCYSTASNTIMSLGVNGAAPSAHGPNAGHSNSSTAYIASTGTIAQYTDGSGSNSYFNRWGGWWQLDIPGLTSRSTEMVQRPWLSAVTPAWAGIWLANVSRYMMFPAFQPGVQRDTYLDPSAGTWSYFADVTPGLTDNITLEPSPISSNVTYLFGGGLSNIMAWNNTTHAWSSPTTTCTGADCTSNHPPVRRAAGFACSTQDNICLMMGGYTSSGGTAYSDTWTFDPSTNAWNELTVSGTYPNNNQNTTWDKLRYEPASNLFVFMGHGIGIIRLFALSTPLGYGRSPATYSATAGPLNRAALGTTWAYEPSITSNGSDIYVSFQESAVGISTTCNMEHAYAATTPNTNTFTNLPAGGQSSVCTSIDTENSGVTYGGKTRITVIAGVPWIGTEKFGAGYNLQASAKSWNGTAWSGGPIGCLLGACTGGGSKSQTIWGLIGSGVTPTAALSEYDYASMKAGLIVAQYSGSWSALGGATALNIGTSGSRAMSAALASDGTNPAVIWAEEVVDSANPMNGATTTPQIYVKAWSGSAWAQLGTSLNRSGTSFASDPTIAYAGGQYYVAWTEHTASGVTNLFASYWNGSAWTTMGGSLNINTSTGNAFHPRLSVSIAGEVYLAWEEQSAVGQHVLGYVDHLVGTSWVPVGGAIAADVTNGSVEAIDISIVGSSPTVIFSELNFGSMRQVYAKQWNGAVWGTIGGAPAVTINLPVTVQESVYPGAGTSGIARTDDPTSVGLPIPIGVIVCGGSGPATCTALASLTLSGTTAGQFRCLAVWSDNSCKWLKVATIASLSAGGTATVTLTGGGSGNFGGSNLATDNGATITVASGSATFTVKKANYNVLDIVDVGATHVVLTGASQGLVLMGPNPTATYPANVTCLPTSGGSACTTAYSSANDGSSTCAIEENGPVMAVLKCDGSLIDGAAHSYMKFTNRMYFYKGKSYTKNTVSLRNADYGTSNTFTTAFKGHQGFELRLTANITGTLSYSVANHTGTPTTGTLSQPGGTDYVYLYQAESTVQKPTTWCGFSGCVAPSPLSGYAIIANGSSVQSGSATQRAEGWANVENSSGVGIEVGHYQLTPYGDHSLEFRGGGTDVRLGLWAAENNTTSLVTLAPNQPYYMQWPQHSINDVYLNFHATTPSSLPNEFLKLQHYLIGRAAASAYNTAGVLEFPLLDPTEEDAYYNCIQSGGSGGCGTPAASPSITVVAASDNTAANAPDGLCSNLAVCVSRFYPWSSGGGGNQMDYRLSRLFNWLRRGYVGQYITAINFAKMEAELTFPRSDGFSWLSHATETNLLGIPDAISTAANQALASQNLVEFSQEHGHVGGLIESYLMTGDETLGDAIRDGMFEMYASSGASNYNLAYGYSGTAGAIFHNERAVGNYLKNTAKLSTFATSIGDTTNAALFLTNGDNVYTTEVNPVACMNTWMGGASGQPCNTTWQSHYSNVPALTGQKGISRERGASFFWGQGIDTNSGCGYDPVVRASAAFQNSIFLQGLWFYRNMRGPGWTYYTQASDLAFGKSRWHLTEMLIDDGTNIWTNNGFRYYELIDVANACNATRDGSGNGGGYGLWGTAGGGTETQWFPFYVTQQYDGTTTWKRNFNQTIQHMVGTGAIDEMWHYTIAAVIYSILHPPNSGAVLQTRTITGFVDNGGGSYTLTWTPPSGSISHRVKYDTAKSVVDWIGFNAGTATFTGNPATSKNWFASTDAPGSPSCATTCSLTVATGQTGLSSSNFMVKSLAPAGANLPTGSLTGGKVLMGPYIH